MTRHSNPPRASEAPAVEGIESHDIPTERELRMIFDTEQDDEQPDEFPSSDEARAAYYGDSGIGGLATT